MGKTVFFAGGGTGGHIYPAIAMARSLIKLSPELDIHFVGSPQGLETKIIPEQGFPLHLVPIGRLNRNVGWWERIKTVAGLPLSLVKSCYLLVRYRPCLLVGVGGYASAPILFVAALMNFRTVIWEPNAYPGLANRWLASWVDLALVVFDEAKLHLSNKVKRIQKVGLPVRQEVEDLARSSLLQKTQNFESSSRPFRVLVFGGSQGARGLNEIVCQAVTSAPDWLKGFELIHQTGVLDFPSIRQRYMGSSLGEMSQQPDASLSASPIQVREYLPRIFEQYQWADLVLCRAGVSTISELAAAGKVAVLVPFPFASDNHQQKNAEAVVKHQAAIMILQKDFTVERFRATLSELKEDPVQRQRLAQNIRRFHRPQAADETARILLKEISGSDTNNG